MSSSRWRSDSFCHRRLDLSDSQNLRKSIVVHLLEFETTERVVAATVDHAIDIEKAVRDAQIADIACLAHSLNLCAEDMLRGVEDVKVVKT